MGTLLILYTNGLRAIRYDFYRKAVLVNIPLYRVEQGNRRSREARARHGRPSPSSMPPSGCQPALTDIDPWPLRSSPLTTLPLALRGSAYTMTSSFGCLYRASRP